MIYIKKIFFLVLMFYFTFTFTFEMTNSLQRLLIYTVPIIIILLNINLLNKSIKIFSKEIRQFILLYLIIIIASISIPIFYNTQDFSYLDSMPLLGLKLLLKTLFLLTVYILLFKYDANFLSYIKYYIFTCCIYIVFSLTFIVLPDLKDFWLSILHISDKNLELLNYEYYVSRIGIDGFAGFIQTFLCTIAILLNMYILMSKPNQTIYYFTLVLLTLGTLLYGRIGSLVAFIVVIVLIVYLLSKIKSFFRGLTLLLIAGGMGVGIFLLGQVNETFNIWLSWAFDYIKNYKENGVLTNSSTQRMFDMYFIPELKTILIGDGWFTDPITNRYYMNTDIGFLRNILFFGLFFSILTYLIVIVLIKGIIKEFHLLKDSKGKFLGISLLLALILFEFKGNVSFTMISIILPLIILLHFQRILSFKKEVG